MPVSPNLSVPLLRVARPLCASLLAACAASPQGPTPVWTAHGAPATNEASDTSAPQHASGAGSELAFEPTGRVDLARALAAALALHPDLAAARGELAAGEADLLEADHGPNPALTLEGEDFAGQGARSGYDDAQTTLSVSQTFERGGKRDARVRLARAERALRRLDLSLAEREVEARVRGAFYAALAAQEELALYRAAEQSATETHAAVAERVAAGKASPMEEAKYSVALGIARLAARDAERAWEAARHALAASWGATEARFDAVDGALSPVPAPLELEQARRGLSDGMRSARLDGERERDAALVDVARAEATADVTLFGGVRRYESTDDLAAILGIELPLQVRNRHEALVRAARERQAAGAAALRSREVALEAELARLWTRHAGARESVAALEAGMLDDAAWVRTSADEAYRAGKLELLDVLDAQRTFLELRARHVEALRTVHTTRAEIDALIGGPAETPRSEP